MKRLQHILWFYHCSWCGAVFVKHHEDCPVCRVVNRLNEETARIAVKGSENYRLPVGVGIQSDVPQ